MIIIDYDCELEFCIGKKNARADISASSNKIRTLAEKTPQNCKNRFFNQNSTAKILPKIHNEPEMLVIHQMYDTLKETINQKKLKKIY